jgi:hypothetical protein
MHPGISVVTPWQSDDGAISLGADSTGANRNTIKVHVKKLAADHYLMQVGKGHGARYTFK